MRYLTSTNRKGYARMLFHRFSEKEWNFLKNDENNKCFSCLMFYSRTGNAGRLEEEITDMKVDILSRELVPPSVELPGVRGAVGSSRLPKKGP